MTSDILTVMWKERKSMFRTGGRKSQLILSLLTPVVMAFYFPWSAGTAWLNDAVSLLIAIVLPLLLVGITIPDAFAGERERHTLGTLLATRLPDRAILIGKMAMPVLVGWGSTVLLLTLSLVTVNIVHWQGKVMFYRTEVYLGDLSISLAFSVLMAAAGVLFSMRSSSVQQAQQSLMSVILVPGMLLQLTGLLVLQSPELANQIKGFLGAFSLAEIILVILTILVLLDVLLLWAAISRFRRPRLLVG